MTLTAPNCPAADFILEDVRMKVEAVDGVNNVEVNLVFEPEWDKDMMTEEAKLELGFYEIYFASDAHLGARFHKDPLAIEKKLVRWLDSIKEDASAIWFLGDLFDYWYEYKYVVPKGHVRFLGKLAELADRGIEIHIFIGNHDIWMFDYLPKEIGAIIHRDTLTVDLLGKRFFLGHGDEVDFRSKAFRLIRAIFRNKFCQWLYAGIHPRWTFGFALGWSLNSRKSGLEKQEAKSIKGKTQNIWLFSPRNI